MSDSETEMTTPHANVCLLLEGTFPYVRGGVSTWVKQMIEGMPHLSFSIIYLGADRETQGEPSYELPANVVHLEAHFLLDERIEEEEGSSSEAEGEEAVVQEAAVRPRQDCTWPRDGLQNGGERWPPVEVCRPWLCLGCLWS